MNIRIGRIGRLFAPGYGACYRCRTPWPFVRAHATRYAPSWACFPLCEKCWADLMPTTRLPYYRRLYHTWLALGCADAQWEDIERAVRAGG